MYSFHFLEAGGPFVGRRYMLNGDHGTVLVFGANGHIAGMQMAVRFFESFFVFFICIFFSGWNVAYSPNKNLHALFHKHQKL